jgi:hypothetical protein
VALGDILRSNPSREYLSEGIAAKGMIPRESWFLNYHFGLIGVSD